MDRSFTDEEAREHNRLYEEGWKLIQDELHVGPGGQRGSVGWTTRRKFVRAVQCFEGALKINPEGWESQWALGKIYQRVEEWENSLAHFARAYELNSQQPDIAREAGLVAMELGAGDDAVRYCQAAAALHPTDAGALANLALAYLIEGDLAQAESTITAARSMASDDDIARSIERLVAAVRSGSRRRPKKAAEIGSI